MISVRNFLMNSLNKKNVIIIFNDFITIVNISSISLHVTIALIKSIDNNFFVYSPFNTYIYIRAFVFDIRGF